MFAPAIPQLTVSLGATNGALDSFVLSVYVIGFTLGPLVVAPLSEIFGRAIVYHVSNVLYIAFGIGCALSRSIGALIAFRFLTGCVGVTPLALGASSIGDIMEPEARGVPMAVWGLGSLVGPVRDFAVTSATILY